MGRKRDKTTIGIVAFVALAGLGCASKPGPGGGAARPGPGGQERAEDGRAGDEAEAAQIAAIEQAVNEFSRAVHSCWAIAASDDFRLEGTVVLALAIGPGGASTDLEVVRDETGDARLTECLLELWSDYSWPDAFREGDRIQLPPFEFVAPEVQYTVSMAHVKPESLEDGKIDASEVLTRRNTGNADAAMSVLRAEPGAKLPLSRHPSAELYFVLSGEAEISDGKEWSKRAGPGAGIYVQAGVPHALRQIGNEPLVALRLAAPGSEGARLGAPGAPEVDRARRRRKLPRPKVRVTADAPRVALQSGDGEAAVLFDDDSVGGGAASMAAVMLRPGVVIPHHAHPDSSEYLFLIEGQGTLEVGDESFSVQGGDAIQVPRGVEHGFEVTGDEPVKAVRFYAPLRAEQRSERADESD